MWQVILISLILNSCTSIPKCTEVIYRFYDKMNDLNAYSYINSHSNLNTKTSRIEISYTEYRVYILCIVKESAKNDLSICESQVDMYGTCEADEKVYYRYGKSDYSIDIFNKIPQ